MNNDHMVNPNCKVMIDGYNVLLKFSTCPAVDMISQVENILIDSIIQKELINMDISAKI